MAVRFTRSSLLLIIFLSLFINNIFITSGALGDRLRKKLNKDKDDDYNGPQPTSEPTEEPTERKTHTCCDCTRVYNDMTRGREACKDKLCVDMISVYNPGCVWYEWDGQCADSAQCICDGLAHDCNE